MTQDIFQEKYLSLHTVGRRSGRLHEVELVFYYEDCNIYLLAHRYGPRRVSSWYRNLEANPMCSVEIRRHRFAAEFIPIDDTKIMESRIREMFRKKMGIEHYQSWYAHTSRLPVVLRVKGQL
jgi:deazaflavin-dependent oxidoreductase (nitroreductase family)